MDLPPAPDYRHRSERVDGVDGFPADGGEAMTARRFFGVLWRVNAVLILVTGVLASAVLVFAIWELFKDATRREARNVLNVASEEIDTSTTRLGDFETVAGAHALRAPLNVEQNYAFGSGSKETTSIQNYLFYDTADGTSRWLLPGHKGLLLVTHELSDRDYTEPKKPTVGFVYEIVDTDTTGDRKLTSKDKKVVGLSDPAGRRFGRLLEGVDDVNGVVLNEKGRAVILYTTAGTLRAAEVDIQESKVVKDGALRPATQP
jgi:hypothetical protein